VAPYRWLIDQRIERAKSLVGNIDDSLVEIALAVLLTKATLHGYFRAPKTPVMELGGDKQDRHPF